MTPTDNGEHPVLDGEPILLGQWLEATDPECNGPDGQTFSMVGQVAAISTDYENVVIVLVPTEGLSEEFYTSSCRFERAEQPEQNARTAGHDAEGREG